MQNSVERHILMTISPTRSDPAVLRSMGTVTPTADDPGFVQTFGEALRDLKLVLEAERCHAFIFPGTGTLGMEALVANWLEPGAKLLVASTGFWGDRMAEVARRHGVVVHHATVRPGEGPDMGALEAELATGVYKALAWTHVDSSTGVRVDCAAMATLARRYCALSLVDGIAGAAAEPFFQDECDVDVYLTATPKAIAVPSGLVLITAGKRAMDALARRTSPVLCYALDLTQWQPVMEAYERGEFGYYNTPAINLSLALATGLRLILEEGLEARWARHARVANAIRAGLQALGLQLVAEEGVQSNALSTVYYPVGVGRELLAEVKAEGVVLAGGYHPQLGPRTFRIGHLGWVTPADAVATIAAIERALTRLGALAPDRQGAGLMACHQAFSAPSIAPALAGSVNRL
jgi:alanine-glyoxylate transaminase/serine-glyoxylate transaminase/serine-pyruvate transaminase